MSGFSLEGKTAFVTGASQGIGAETARRLAAHGARVILAARSVEKLEAIATRLRDRGCECSVLELDVAAPGQVPERVRQLAPPFDQVDILVNNAGVTADNLLVRMKPDEWDRVLQVNLTGAFAVTQALCRGMMRRRWGRIVSISSVVGLMGNAGQANYAAAKAGLVGFSKSLARELATRNVTVNVVAPGFVETAMTEGLAEKVQRELLAAIPLQRKGTAAEVAAAVVFLASEEAGYITGHVLNVSGGLYI